MAVSSSPGSGVDSLWLPPRVWFLQLLDALLQLFHGHLGLLEGAALDAVRQGQLGRQGDIPVGDGRAAFEGGLGAGGLEDHQVGAVPVHVQRSGQRGDREQVAAWYR